MATNGDVSIATVADGNVTDEVVPDGMSHQSWRRILLLIIAITVHNIPGWYTTFHFTAYDWIFDIGAL